MEEKDDVECNSDAVTRQITISRLWSDTTYFLAFDSVENPGDFYDLGYITMATYTQGNGLIDENTTGIQIENKFEATRIQYFYVKPQSTQAGNFPVTYDF